MTCRKYPDSTAGAALPPGTSEAERQKACLSLELKTSLGSQAWLSKRIRPTAQALAVWDAGPGAWEVPGRAGVVAHG